MALGRNHRIFNIGNSSGSYGISRVYHDSTLSGDGTLSSLLGVVDAGDTEVNEFVYNNSGDIINVDNVVQSNSGEWGNGGESYSALTSNSANWNDISAYQENSGSYQPLGNYIPYTGIESSLSAFKTNSGLMLQETDNKHCTYLGSYDIHLQHVDILSNINNQSLLSTARLTFRTKSDSAYVDREKIHKWDNVSDYTQNNSANWNEVSSKLDASAFDPNEFYPMTGNPSGFLTAVDLSNYYTKSETSGADELASAFNNIPHGDPDVNTYVQNNSATINEVNTTYQQNSGTYLTAHQDISNKLDVSAFSDVSGTFLTAVPAGYATTGEVNSVSSILSAAIESNSGIVYTGIDPIVVNNDDKAISANTWAFSAGDGISFVDDNVNKITRIDVTAQGGNAEVESYVINNSATIDDVNTTYQNASATYLTAHQDLSNYVPVSSYNELKTSYDALSSLFATYSGQWLLPNTGV